MRFPYEYAQRCFTMISLLPADRKHISARVAGASKRCMYAGTRVYLLKDQFVVSLLVYLIDFLGVYFNNTLERPDLFLDKEI